MAASEETECYESWEEMEDSGLLDRKLAIMHSALTNNHENNLRCSDNKGTVMILDDDTRTRYGPSEPTVKILKRPPLLSGTNGLMLNGDCSKPKLPVKTLQQRELEYAEARLRILGEARSPEEGSNVDERIQKIQHRIELLRPGENDAVLRYPKGPDGTRGFNLRR
uniref:SUZ RNA-binding domain-containing n=2 Tax=Clastoptera arizonana TaxID=38151 RepID=A0A1B6CJC6_9HEMI